MKKLILRLLLGAIVTAAILYGTSYAYHEGESTLVGVGISVLIIMAMFIIVLIKEMRDEKRRRIA